jgi:hypothetical protein
MDSKGFKIVYTVVNNKDRSYWVRIGACFLNKDGSWNVKLDAIPTNGTLQIREQEERRDDAAFPPRRQAPALASTTPQVEAFA